MLHAMSNIVTPEAEDNKGFVERDDGVVKSSSGSSSSSSASSASSSSAMAASAAKMKASASMKATKKGQAGAAGGPKERQHGDGAASGGGWPAPAWPAPASAVILAAKQNAMSQGSHQTYYYGSLAIQGGTCADTNQFCPAWAEERMCQGKDEEFMRQNCPKSCLLCPCPSYTTEQCHHVEDCMWHEEEQVCGYENEPTDVASEEGEAEGDFVCKCPTCVESLGGQHTDLAITTIQESQAAIKAHQDAAAKAQASAEAHATAAAEAEVAVQAFTAAAASGTQEAQATARATAKAASYASSQSFYLSAAAAEVAVAVDAMIVAASHEHYSFNNDFAAMADQSNSAAPAAPVAHAAPAPHAGGIWAAQL